MLARPSQGRRVISYLRPRQEGHNEVKRFENIPNRHEPYTVKMQKCLFICATGLIVTCLLGARADWFAVNLQGGNRLLEWCQTGGAFELHKFQTNPRKDCHAFTFGDAIFHGNQKVRISPDATMANPDSVISVELYYRWQRMETTVKRSSSLATQQNPTSVRSELGYESFSDSSLSVEQRTMFPSLSIKIHPLEKFVRTSCASWQ